MDGDDKNHTSTSLGGGTVPSEDFLYHLHRGSDLLMQDRVVEAKEELEQALTQQPQDAKSQDLLAGVYFRLGVYPRAIELWSHLVAAYPKDPTLRVNLGLALFKTGQHQAALEHIHQALRIQPDHERAWGYLGLIHWRRGELEEARDAFLRGGQASMARRMEQSITSSGHTPAVGAAAPAGTAEPAEPDVDEQWLRSAAEEALVRMEAEDLQLAASESRDRSPGDWQTVAPGEEPVPLVRRRPTGAGAPPAAPVPPSGEAERPPALISAPAVAGPVEPTVAPATLATVVARCTVHLPRGVPLAVAPSGVLHVDAESGVFARLAGLIATRGVFRTAVVKRRTRGTELDEVLGDDDPIMRWYGPVGAVVAPPEGKQFHAIRLEPDEVLYVREDVLEAFDDRVGCESGRLALRGRQEVIAQLQGPGSVVLRLSAQPTGIAVARGGEVRVDPAHLVGWTGRLIPKSSGGTLPYAATAPPLSFQGEGTVLLA